jgi:hypothetical protein
MCRLLQNNRRYILRVLTALYQLGGLEPAVKEKCSAEASRLAESMVERLKEWSPVACCQDEYDECWKRWPAMKGDKTANPVLGLGVIIDKLLLQM